MRFSFTIVRYKVAFVSYKFTIMRKTVTIVKYKAVIVIYSQYHRDIVIFTIVSYKVAFVSHNYPELASVRHSI